MLQKQYILLFDKDILLFLKQVDFLDPIHSIQFLAFSFCRWSIQDFYDVGRPHLILVFLNFFLDPSRSGKYHLTPQHHANVAVWMIQSHYPLPKAISVRLFPREDRRDIETPLAGFLSNRFGDELKDQTMVVLIDIHLSHASRCADQLIEIIRSYDHDTFPLMALSIVRDSIAVRYHS